MQTWYNTNDLIPLNSPYRKRSDIIDLIRAGSKILKTSIVASGKEHSGHSFYSADCIYLMVIQISMFAVGPTVNHFYNFPLYIP